MRTRLLLGVIGVAIAGFGALRFLQLDAADVVDAVLWLAAGVIVHDAVIAPLTIGLTVLGARVLPGRSRTAVVVGLVVLVTVTVSAVPVLGGWGVRPDNPTVLDRNYLVGWLVFAGLVTAGVLAGALAGPALRGRRPGSGPEASGG